MAQGSLDRLAGDLDPEAPVIAVSVDLAKDQRRTRQGKTAARNDAFLDRRAQATAETILGGPSAVIYCSQMIEVRQTPVFRKWLDDLVDRCAAERIAQRIVRLQAGLLGDVKPVGGGVSELRVDYEPG